MPKRYAVIDGDTELFIQAARGEVETDDGWLPTKSIDAMWSAAMRAYEKQAEAVGADDIVLALTSGTNFRKSILPTYKSNRTTARKPAGLTELRAKVQQSFPLGIVVTVPNLEADDVAAITAGTLDRNGREAVMISPDKDFGTVPGLWFNPRPTASGKQREIEHTSLAMADYNHMLQTLTGDATDGYSGCPGVGPIKARTLLNDCEHLLPWQRWELIVETFNKAGLSEEDALVQARVARILRADDWDAVNRVPIYWTAPLPVDGFDEQ